MCRAVPARVTVLALCAWTSTAFAASKPAPPAPPPPAPAAPAAPAAPPPPPPLSDDLPLDLPPVKALAIGGFTVEGLDEARTAMVQARLDQVGSALAGLRVFRIEGVAGGITQLRPLCNTASVLGADVVLTGKVVFRGETGTIELFSADTKLCSGRSLEREIPRRVESTVLAVLDEVICRVAFPQPDAALCRSQVALKGDANGLQFKVNGEPATPSGNALSTDVGVARVQACEGGTCTAERFVDLPLGQPGALEVARACGKLHLVAPGELPACVTEVVVQETVRETPVPWAGIGTTAAGAAVLVAAVVFGLEANRIRDDIEAGIAGATLTRTEATRLVGNMDASALRSNVAWVGGGLLVAAGATFLVLQF